MRNKKMTLQLWKDDEESQQSGLEVSYESDGTVETSQLQFTRDGAECFILNHEDTHSLHDFLEEISDNEIRSSHGPGSITATPGDIRIAMGNNLREARAERNMALKELAEMGAANIRYKVQIDELLDRISKPVTKSIADGKRRDEIATEQVIKLQDSLRESLVEKDVALDEMAKLTRENNRLLADAKERDEIAAKQILELQARNKRAEIKIYDFSESIYSARARMDAAVGQSKKLRTDNDALIAEIDELSCGESDITETRKLADEIKGLDKLTEAQDSRISSQVHRIADLRRQTEAANSSAEHYKQQDAQTQAAFKDISLRYNAEHEKNRQLRGHVEDTKSLLAQAEDAKQKYEQQSNRIVELDLRVIKMSGDIQHGNEETKRRAYYQRLLFLIIAHLEETRRATAPEMLKLLGTWESQTMSIPNAVQRLQFEFDKRYKLVAEQAKIIAALKKQRQIKRDEE